MNSITTTTPVEITEYCTKIKMNVHNAKWYIEYLPAPKKWYQVADPTPTYVTDPVPYMSPSGEFKLLVLYFNSAAEAREYVKANILQEEAAIGESDA